MVRIILHKAGVFVDDNILFRLEMKCTEYFIVKATTQANDRAMLILDTDKRASEVIMTLSMRNKSIECPGCNSIHIRGTLPTDTPFRCSCGKWLLTKKS